MSTQRNRRIISFVEFCLDHQIKMSIILWLLIIMAGVSIYQAVT